MRAKGYCRKSAKRSVKRSRGSKRSVKRSRGSKRSVKRSRHGKQRGGSPNVEFAAKVPEQGQAGHPPRTDTDLFMTALR
jgi:hypothetical protein